MSQALHPPEGKPGAPETTEPTSTVLSRLTAVLQRALDPSRLEITDESHHHAGHAGWRSTGETHVRVKVVSEAFSGRSRIERHRVVNELAAGELRSGLHALAIEAHAPDEIKRTAPAEHGASGSAR